MGVGVREPTNERRILIGMTKQCFFSKRMTAKLLNDPWLSVPKTNKVFWFPVLQGSNNYQTQIKGEKLVV